MKITDTINQILDSYQSDNSGTRANLYRILMSGKLAGTGYMVILPVDQGFEHGPARSFAVNPEAYDPEYHIKLAIDAGLNAYAAPLGMLETVAAKYAGQIPTILKVNSANSMTSSMLEPYQAITGSVQDALRLGCAAIGFTIYPGSDMAYKMIGEISRMSTEAKANGLAVVVWSYPRGGDLEKDDENALDIISYSAHIASLIGAHIIKVKLPTDRISSYIEQNNSIYQDNNIEYQTLTQRVTHIKQACFAGKRLVVFSGGSSKSSQALYEEVRAIRDGGGNGSIIGRNIFQRPRTEALKMLDKIIAIYKETSKTNSESSSRKLIQNLR